MVNSLAIDDCDILEKVINFTNVHEHSDGHVSIKIQKFRSRHANFVYFNCSRVVCECHGYRRGREPSRSQKSGKQQRYVWCPFRKDIIKSPKVHLLMKYNARRKLSTYKTRVRCVKK